MTKNVLCVHGTIEIALEQIQRDIAANSRRQKCRKLRYVCHELKHKCSCAIAIYLNLNPNDIRTNFEFTFYFNKTDVKPYVLDGGYQIILANWPKYKRIICTNNNNIPVSIPSHPYVLLNSSILCDCDIEAESNFLLESLATCEEGNKPDLEMYFTVNLAFVHYLDLLNETIETPVVRNWTMQKQILPISLETVMLNLMLIRFSIRFNTFNTS